MFIIIVLTRYTLYIYIYIYIYVHCRIFQTKPCVSDNTVVMLKYQIIRFYQDGGASTYSFHYAPLMHHHNLLY